MEDIKGKIVKQLDKFHPDIPKYTEQMKQGFEEPAFFILQLSGSNEKEIDRRYKRSSMFDIHYFPDSKGLTEKADCEAMAELLYEQLEYIQGENAKLRSLHVKHEVVANVLHFFVNYEVRLIKTREADPKMKSLDMEEKLK